MTKYGYSTIGIVAIIVFFLFASAIFLNNSYLRIPLIVIGLFLLIFTLNFFRDPDRTLPARKDVVVSPADGTVILIKEVAEEKFIKGKCLQLSIFMSPLNVHVNRIPIDGRVEYLNYVQGDYLVASNDKASLENERAEFGISNKNGKIFFTQVAGFVARRIIYEINIGDEVKIGERFGMIKFGSRVDVVVPLNWKVKVKKGDKVTAGETILFEYNK
ncbi:MAG: phosphatidylserine decarboxylase family protein [Ignavibacteriales bacterium]|nr:phosphatidylserine decarboxylase family protein [Ignavibacteriales bacterium]